MSLDNKNNIVITISGVPGAGTTTIGRLLSQRLNIKMVYIGEIFRELAKENKMTLEEYGMFADNNPEIDLKLDERQLKIGRAGNVILEGRLSAWMMKKYNIDAFKILLTADLDTRIRRIMGRENKKFDQVKSEIETRENVELRRYNKIYKMSYLDESIYDLIIDTTNLSPEQIIEKVLNEIKKSKSWLV